MVINPAPAKELKGEVAVSGRDGLSAEGRGAVRAPTLSGEELAVDKVLALFSRTGTARTGALTPI
jgi:hypothetical protein